MDGYLIFKICQICGGDGKMPRTAYDEQGNPTADEAECVVCNGTGHVLWGYITKDKYELPNDLPIPA